MLNNYLKIAFRNLRKHWIQSLTGIFSLAFVLVCLVSAVYWIRYEKSYDGFYSGSDRIYRVYTMEKQSGKVNTGSSKIVERKLRENIPQIDAATTFIRGQENCSAEKISHIKLELLYADNSFFSVFPRKIICGEKKDPLRVLNDMVLTEAMAIRLFGDVEEAIGQQVRTKMNESAPPYTVTAVVEDFPENSNLICDALIYHDMLNAFSTMPEEAQWSMLFMEVYVKFTPNVNIKEIIDQSKELPSRLKTNENISICMVSAMDVRYELEANSPFTLNFIRLFVIAGVLLLVSVIFNFLNLYFDLFRQRIRELNLRSINGATTKQLIFQLMFEMMCSVLLALILGGGLLVLVYPAFSGLLDIKINVSSLALIYAICSMVVFVILFIFSLVFFMRLVAGALEPRSKARTNGFWYKRLAVVLQLFVSIVFIIATLIVMRQMNYINQKNLGLDSENLIQLSGFVDYSGRIEGALINEIAAIPQVLDISDASFEPKHNVDPLYERNDIKWSGSSSETPLFSMFYADNNFANTLGLTLIDGSWWNEGQQTKVVLNEEAISQMELIDPVGRLIQMPSVSDPSVMADYEIAGVVKDFHALSFRSEIRPMVFMPAPYLFNIMYIRTERGCESQVIQKINTIIKSLDSSLVDVKITPVAEVYERLNSSEQIGLKLFSILALVCLLISLFAVYAVALTSTLRRRKEIAVRKVAGAKIIDIIVLFFKEYIIQVFAAAIFALPIVYLIMNYWLQEYAYRTNIPVWLLLEVIVGMIILVMLTICGNIVKAANRNLAEEIKRE